MNRPATVAVVRSDNRRGAVAQALSLIADDLRATITAEVLIKPNLTSHRRQFPSTHADTLSATLDAILAAGGRRVIVAEGGSDAPAGFERFGFRKEVMGRPVSFLDLHREEPAWDSIDLTSVAGKTLRARVSRTVAASSCRVSLAVARTDDMAALALGLKNMMSCVHPDDRIMMSGHAGGENGSPGWKKRVVEFLKGDSFAVNALTRIMGRARNVRAIVTGKARDNAWRNFTRENIDALRVVEAMNRNLVALTGAIKPHVSVVDGFMAMHREGPRHGTPIKLGTIVAGTDAVAVDAVAAAVMGFDPMRVGYLSYAHTIGLGVADLDAIRVVGDPIAIVRRACVPHSNHVIQRHWDRLPEIGRPDSAVPAPHAAVTRALEPSRR